MKMKSMFLRIFLVVALILNICWAHAQEKGVISGKITDKQTGEELIGAAVFIPSLSTGGTADLDGNYSISVPAGTYDLKVSYVSYAGMTIERVEVIAGERTTMNIAMDPNTELLKEVVIEATQVRSSEVAILSMQRKSVSIQDGISSGEMSKMGISDAAQALTQVTGSAVEDGKYLVVRGLGDRYSLSLLDGIILPSVDPLRNSTSLDLIPAAMIDNVIIRKTYTADLPGNFSGGLAEVSSKSMPDEFYLNAGISIGYNTNATFNDGFMRDQTRGSYDWLGYDDGARSLPNEMLEYQSFIQSGDAISSANLGRQPENVAEREAIDATSKSFETSFVPEQITPSLNQGVDISFGDRYDLGGDKLFGVNVGLNYGRNFSQVSEGQFNTYTSNTNSLGNFVPNVGRDFDLLESQENVETGAMLGLTFQLNPNNRFMVKNLYNHLGTYSATTFSGLYPDAISSAQAEFNSKNVGYTEKMVNFTTLTGEHLVKGLNRMQIDWTVGYNFNQQNQPDLRLFAYVIDNDNYSIRRSETAGDPRRFFRELSDNQVTGKIDFAIPFDIGENNKLDLKFGAYLSNKERDFTERYYDIPLTNSNFTNPSYVTFGAAEGDFESFFAHENMGIVDTPESNGSNLYGFGNIYREMTIPSNQYVGTENIYAGYIMGTTNITKLLKVVAGLRIEHTDLSTVNEGPETIFVQDPVDPDEVIEVSSNGNIKVTDLLPSLNLIYNLTEKSTIRGGVSQTIARPNMREISPFRSLGSIGADIVIGNPQLERTLIQNFDLRFETYPRPGEIIAVSAYFKRFQNPIVVNIYSTGSAIEQQPNNVAEATVYGAEFEIRKKLDFISESLKSLKVIFNTSVTYSQVNKPQRELEQLEGFNGAESVNSDTRPFQGQSPYIVNTALMHTSEKLKWENGLRFNIWGRRLSYQTPAQVPDVYEVSRPSLDFSSSKQFGEHLTISFKVMNILDMEYRQEFDFVISGVDNAYRSYRMGRTFSLGITYSI